LEKPCCIGVVRDPSKLKGKEDKLDHLVIYETTPDPAKKKNLGVVVVHDIFGFRIPNSKYVVDYLASEGFDAVMGNHFNVVGSWPEERKLSDDEFGLWFGKISSPEFLSNLEKQIESLVNHLKKKRLF